MRIKFNIKQLLYYSLPLSIRPSLPYPHPQILSLCLLEVWLWFLPRPLLDCLSPHNVTFATKMAGCAQTMDHSGLPELTLSEKKNYVARYSSDVCIQSSIDCSLCTSGLHSTEAYLDILLMAKQSPHAAIHRFNFCLHVCKQKKYSIMLKISVAIHHI